MRPKRLLRKSKKLKALSKKLSKLLSKQSRKYLIKSKHTVEEVIEKVAELEIEVL